MRKFLIATMLMLMASITYGQGTINYTSGTYDGGEVVTIIGTGFGVKSPVAPLMWDNFENGVEGETLPILSVGGDPIGGINPDYVGRTVTYANPTYRSVAARSGNFGIDNSGSIHNFNEMLFLTGWTDELFVSYYQYESSPTDERGCSALKQIRFVNSQSDKTVYYNGSGTSGISGSPQYKINASGSQWNHGRAVSYTRLFPEVLNYIGYVSMDMNAWNYCEMYKKLSTPGVADGKLRGVINEQTQEDYSLMTREVGGSYQMDAVWINLGGSECTDSQIRMDDLYIDNTEMRVVIGDASTYSECIKFDMQIPQNTWIDTTIEILFNRGIYSAGDDAWLYVIDANGNASPGYYIEIEGSAGSTNPTIINASATIADGGALTIQGVNFGNKETATPLFWDNLKTTSYNGLSDGSVIPTVDSGCPDCPWGENVYDSEPIILNLSAHNGRPGPHYKINMRGAFVGAEDYGLLLPSYFTIDWWHSLNTSYRRGPDDVENSAKLSRIWSNPNFTARSSQYGWKHMYRSYYIDDYDCPEPGIPCYHGWSANYPELQQDVWNHHRLEFFNNEGMNTTGGGRFIASINGNVVTDSDANGYPLASEEAAFDFVWKIGFTPSEYWRIIPGTEMNFQDIYIDSSQARVIITDNQNWDGSSSIGHYEVQIPATWIDTEINITTNTGSFSIGDNVYIYVVDENRNVSNSFGPIEVVSLTTDPTIINYSGDFVDGGSVTLSGINFGTKSVVDPVRWETFDDYGIDGQRFEDIQGWWNTYTDNPVEERPKLSSNNLRTGNGLNAEIYMERVYYENDVLYKNTIFPDERALVSFWVRHHRGTPDIMEDGAGQIKLFRICHSTEPNEGPWFYFHNSYDDDGTGGTWTENISGGGINHGGETFYAEIPYDGSWSQVTIEFDAGTEGVADGEVRVWLNGSKIIDHTTQFSYADTRTWESIRFGEYIGNTIGQMETTQYFDDIYLDTSWARIEIGNSSNYSSCSHREIQIPSSWDSENVSITVNTGSFSTNDEIYIFLIDENGNASTGYGPITISGTNDPTPYISTHNGSLTDGTSMTLNGGNFGTKRSNLAGTTGETWKFDDAEGNSNGDVVTPYWDIVEAGSDPEEYFPSYDNGQTRTGSTMSLMTEWHDPGSWTTSFGDEDYTNDLSEVFIDVWMYILPPSPESRNHKIIRLTAGHGDGQPNMYQGTVCYSDYAFFTWEGTEPGPGRLGINHKNDIWNKWSHWQYWHKVSTPGVENGEIKVWVNGEKKIDRTDIMSRDINNTDTYHSVWFGMYLDLDAGPICPSTPGPAYVWWDDVYVDISRNRIEIGDNSDYESCTIREIQSITTWGGNSISITVNTGAFAQSENVYVFSVDKDGLISDGYGPLVIQNSSDPYINGHSGAFINGEAINITGGNFGVTQGTIFIGDNQIYGNCTQTQSQTITSWGTSSIDFTLNTGSFGIGDLIYIFAIDNGGTASFGDGPIQIEAPPTPIIQSTQGVPADGESLVIMGINFEAIQGTGTVYIGNNSIWGSVTVSVEQTVVTYWSDFLIEITLDIGSFTAADNTYLFVFDNSGDVSNGFSIQLPYGFIGDPINLIIDP